MKEQEQIKQTNLTEEVRQVKVDSKKHVGTVIPHEGHSVFEFNKVNFQLRKATLEDVSTYTMTTTKGARTQTMRKRVKVNDNCFYISCLNAKNAIKQINKRFNPEFVLVLTD